MFEATLKNLVASIEGALGAAVMNRYGVVVASVISDNQPPNTLDALPDLGPVYEQIDALRELVDLGDYRSLSFRTDQRVILIRPLNADYLAVFSLTPHVIIGRAKFKLRVAAPLLAAEL